MAPGGQAFIEFADQMQVGARGVKERRGEKERDKKGREGKRKRKRDVAFMIQYYGAYQMSQSSTLNIENARGHYFKFLILLVFLSALGASGGGGKPLEMVSQSEGNVERGDCWRTRENHLFATRVLTSHLTSVSAMQRIRSPGTNGFSLLGPDTICSDQVA